MFFDRCIFIGNAFILMKDEYRMIIIDLIMKMMHVSIS